MAPCASNPRLPARISRSASKTPDPLAVAYHFALGRSGLRIAGKHHGGIAGMRTRVLIVGGGPVGLTLAIDLAWRGIDVTFPEPRPPNDPPNVKCGQIGARSMEIFRRLGLADKLRGIGLPADYPNDIVSATSVTGIKPARLRIPASFERGTLSAAGPDTV